MTNRCSGNQWLGGLAIWPAMAGLALGAPTTKVPPGKFRNPINPGADPWLVCFEGSTGKPDYKLGMLSADDTAEVMDPVAWKQHPQPVFLRNDDAGVFTVLDEPSNRSRPAPSPQPEPTPP